MIVGEQCLRNRPDNHVIFEYGFHRGVIEPEIARNIIEVLRRMCSEIVGKFEKFYCGEITFKEMEKICTEMASKASVSGDCTVLIHLRIHPRTPRSSLRRAPRENNAATRSRCGRNYSKDQGSVPDFTFPFFRLSCSLRVHFVFVLSIFSSVILNVIMWPAASKSWVKLLWIYQSVIYSSSLVSMFQFQHLFYFLINVNSVRFQSSPMVKFLPRFESALRTWTMASYGSCILKHDSLDSLNAASELPKEMITRLKSYSSEK